MPAASTLVDGFLGTTLGAQWSQFSATNFATVNGALFVPCTTDYPGIQTPASYTLAGSSLLFELKSAPTTGLASIRLRESTANRLEFGFDLGQVYTLVRTNSVTTQVNHGPAPASSWLRVRDVAGTLLFEASPTGLPGTWALIHSIASPAWLSTPAAVQLRAGSASGTGTAVFDNVNLEPAPPPPPPDPEPEPEPDGEGGRPALTPAGARLYEQLEPRARDDGAHGWAMAHLAGALATMIDRAHGYAHDADVPWGSLYDVEQTPDEALEHVAQYIGVQLLGSLTAAGRRIRTREAGGLRRGTVAAIKGAALPHLVSTDPARPAVVEVLERDGGDAYRLRVVTYAAETPNPAQVEAALRAEKPAGLVLIYEVRPGQSYDQARQRHTTYDAGRLAYPSYGAARDYLPA